MVKLRWDEHTYPEIEERLREDPIVIFPIGSVEAHGYHLPLNTDMLQPMWLAERIAEELNALIIPPLPYGWTENLKSFKGTISIGFSSLHGIVKDILTSLVSQGVRKIVVLSGHASTNHMAALRLACEEVVRENRNVKIMLLSDYYIAYKYRGDFVPADDGHAGVIETSRVMAIRPDLVKESYKFEKKEYGKYMVIVDYKDVVPYATFSDPHGATKELGKKLNNLILEELIELIKENFKI